MSDITQAIEQDAIADSLVAPLESESQFVEQYGEHESGEEHGGQERSDDWQQINDELRAETARLQERPEQEAAQPVEVTPQAIQEGLQQLDQAVNELGLNDPAEATILASALGVDPANSVPLGTVMAKTTLSALHVLEQAGGDLSKIGPIPRESAVAFSNDFLRALGMDPRMSQANPEQLASVVLSGTLSFLKAVETYGVNASLDVLNSAEASEWFVNGLLQCFGSNQRAERQYAVSLADAGGRYLLSVLRKLDTQRAEQPRQGRQGQGTRSAGTRQRSGGRSRMKTNQDLFDDEAMEAYRLRHGAL